MNTRLKIERHYFASLLLIVVTLAAYLPIFTNGFVNYDDQVYVTENKDIQKGLSFEGFRWAFTTGHAANWHPLTWISHLADYQIFGLNPWGHHLTSLLLHIANTLLLFHVLRRMTGAVWQSAVVAAMFALHPLHVESVAWVAERKDVLSSLFWMLTLLGYIRYVEKRELKRYLVVTITFALGLMAKPMLVTLPLILLLLDYWPLDRVGNRGLAPGRSSNPEQTEGTKQKKPHSTVFTLKSFLPLVREKIPLFVLAAASSAATFIAQQGGGAVARVSLFTIEERVTNALMSYVRYLGNMVWPASLAVFYPYRSQWPGWQLLGAGVFLAIVSFLAIHNLKRFRYLAVGWLWYIVTLLPVIGLVQVGSQAMADRYTYIPLLGVFIIIVWGIPDLLSRWRFRRIVVRFGTAGMVGVLLVLTSIQVRTWQNTEALMEHATKVTKDNWVAHSNLGLSLSGQGRYTEALEQFKEAVRIHPGFAEAQHGMALTLAKLGRVNEAIPYYEAALRIQPDYTDAHNNLGAALVVQGKTQEAMNHYVESLRINPENPGTHNNLGSLLGMEGKLDEAVFHFKEAIRLNPDYEDARNNLKLALSEKERTTHGITQQRPAIQGDAIAMRSSAELLAKQGKVAEAIVQYKEALRIKPDLVEARNELAVLLGKEGKVSEAIDQLMEALKINPNFIDAQNNLGIALAMQGRTSEAVHYLSAAIKGDPLNANTRYNLGIVLAKSGQIDEAITQYREALRIRPDYPEAKGELERSLRQKREGRGGK